MDQLAIALAWAIDLATNLFVPGALALTVLAAGLAVLRRWRLALISALPVPAMVFWIAASYGAVMPLEPEAGGTPLRVMNFNILVFNQDHARKNAFIRAQNADVVLLQETNPRWWAEFEALDDLYPYRRREGPIGVLVFSRYPLGETEARILSPWPEGVKRPTYLQPGEGIIRAIKVPVEVDGRRVTLISVHVNKALSPAGFMRRNGDFAQVADFVRQTQGPVIVGGDFNTTPMAPRFQTFLADTGLRGLPPGALPALSTWPASLPAFGLHIDHQLTRGPIRLRGYSLRADASSNHRAVIADYVLPK